MTRYEDKSGQADARQRSHDAYAQGCQLYGDCAYAEARAAFERALEYWPEDAYAWFALGNCHDATQGPARAEVCYRMALKFAATEKQAEVYYNLGNSLFDQQQYNKAIECYARVDAHSAAYDAAQKNMALARKQSG